MTENYAQLRGVFERALQTVDVAGAVAKQVTIVGDELLLGGLRCRTRDFDRVLIIALGKAANQMYLGVERALEAGLPARCSVEAVVVSPSPPPVRHGTIFCEGPHPIPDDRSIRAADTVLGKLRDVDERTVVLFLISGGASSMIERPVDSGVSIEEVREFYALLIDSGLPIEEMNVLRKHLSAVKGGRLAEVAKYALAMCTLVISDLPQGSITAVGSGPSIASAPRKADCLRILESLPSKPSLPVGIASFFESERLHETPCPKGSAFHRHAYQPVMSDQDLAAAAASAAKEAQFYAVVDNTCDEWDYVAAARYLLNRATHLRRRHRRFCLISVGEVAVRIQGPSGRGGRNQQFALWCATEIERQGLDFTVLSVGSDGVDGRSPVAGAIVDRTTCERAKRHGLDVEQSLREFDAYTIFHALGDAVGDGPTGNNLRDLRIVIGT